MTEIKIYLKLFKKYLPVIIVLVFLGIAAGYYYTVSQSIKYQSSLIFYVKHTVVAPSNFYNYDGYYAILAAKEYTDTVVGILKTPEVKNEVLTKSGLQDSFDILVKKTAPQLVNFSAISTNAKTSENYVQALSRAGKNKIVDLNKNNGDDGLSLELLSETPQTEILKPSLKINLTIGFLAGLLFSLLLTPLVEFFRKNTSQ